MHDVAVIGLGAMGSAALYHLARRGLSVAGMERFEPGHDHGSSHGESRAIRLGYFEHPSYVPFARSAYRNWRELEQFTGEKVLSITGVLEIGRPDSAIVNGSIEASRQHDLPHEVLDAGEIMRRFPNFALPEGYFAVQQPDGGVLDADRANALHLALARQAGADIRVNCKVKGIDAGASLIRIATDNGLVEARRAIVAAGPWIGDLVPNLKPHLTLARQVICWFEPGKARPDVLPQLPVFLVDDGEDVIYGFPPSPEHGFKLASHYDSGIMTDADAPRTPPGPQDEARIRRFLDRFMPDAAGPLIQMKTCIYTKTPDEDFVIDFLPEDDRIVIASPCSGHGYKFASVIGEVLADLATVGHTEHDISRFRLARLQAGHSAT